MAVDLAGRRATRIAKVWIDVVWWLAVVTSTILAVMFLLSPILLNQGFDSVGVDVSVADDTWSRSLPLTSPDPSRVSSPTVRVEAGETRLTFRTTRMGLFFLSIWYLPPLLAAVLLCVYLFRAFLADVLAGEVFTRINAQRLSKLAWLVIGLGIAEPLAKYATSWMVLRSTQLSGVAMRPASSLELGGPVLGGVLLLILAAVWRYGTELQRERDLTV